MEMMSRAEFKELAKKDPYYRKRWHYFKKVIDILQEISFESCLELGPYKRPIVHGCDVIDIRKHLDNLTYRHDATKTPWPIDDAKYDLFIALQVWEHLQDKQQDAFREVMRIAKKAILSFPLNWDLPGDIHDGITEEKISEWTLNIEPAKKIKAVKWNLSVRHPIKKLSRARIIFLYEF